MRIWEGSGKLVQLWREVTMIPPSTIYNQGDDLFGSLSQT